MLLDTLLTVADSILLAILLLVVSGERSKSKMILFAGLMFVTTEWKTCVVNAAQDAKILTVFSIIPLVMMTMFIALIYNKMLLESMCLTLGITVFVSMLQGFAMLVCFLCKYLVGIVREGTEHLITMQFVYIVLFAISLYKLGSRLSQAFEYIRKWVSHKYKQKNVGRLIVCLLVISIVMVVTCYFVYSDVSDLTTFFYAGICTIVALILICIWYLETLKNTYELEELREQVATQKIHNDFVKKMNQFGHSYNNLMQVLGILLSYDDLTREQMCDLKEAVQGILKWNEDNDLNFALKYTNIPNIIVSSILSAKDKYAKSLGVELLVLRQGSTMLTLNSKDCIDVLTILLDNAIQCACKSDCKRVTVNLDFGVKMFSCKITNYFAVDENGVVLKESQSHGEGLSIVKSLAARNSRFRYENWTEDNSYTASIKYRNVTKGGSNATLE